MIRSIRLNKLTLLAAALAALLTVACRTAEAQVKPFKVSGEGVAERIPLTPGDSAAHWAEGEATFLGHYFGEGFVRLDKFTSPTTADFSSSVPFVFTAANGDNLAFHYGRVDFGAAKPGNVTLTFLPDLGPTMVYAVFVAEFNPVPALCTGRFTKVTSGSFIMTAITEPFDLLNPVDVGYEWEGEGHLTFSKGK